MSAPSQDRLLATVTDAIGDLVRAIDKCIAIDSTLRTALIDRAGGETTLALRELAAACLLARELRGQLEDATAGLMVARAEAKKDETSDTINVQAAATDPRLH